MFSDSLARLTSTESSIGALQIMASTYSYDAVELLTTPEASTSSFADVPDSFSREAFSGDELKMLATDSSAHLVGTQPVTRTIHYRLVYCVPASQVHNVWSAAHLSAESSHLTFTVSQANLAHLHWGGKSGSGPRSLKRLFAECKECQATLPEPRDRYHSAQGARPSRFGQLVMFDTKSFPIFGGGKQYIGTSLDKATGLLRCLLIASPNEDEAIRQVNDWLCCGVAIEVAYFDQHVSYVRSRKFRLFLRSKSITAMFSKGNDPRFISDLETAHRLLNNWVRTAADPLAWPPTMPGFEEFYNSAASTRTGVSPGGMALGHSAASSRAIAMRHKTLVLSIADRSEPDPPRVEAGNWADGNGTPRTGRKPLSSLSRFWTSSTPPA
jgi:hypothetical protein